MFILVICDRFTKLTRTVPLRRITAPVCANTFFYALLMSYGVPVHILTDRGLKFVSKFFRTLCDFVRVQGILTTAFHPQANGLTERYNKTIVTSIRPYMSEHQNDWDVHLSPLTYAYNNHVHRSTNCRPFELTPTRCPPDASLLQPPSLMDEDSLTKTALLIRVIALRTIKYYSSCTAVINKIANYNLRVQQHTSTACNTFLE